MPIQARHQTYMFIKINYLFIPQNYKNLRYFIISFINSTLINVPIAHPTITQVTRFITKVKQTPVPTTYSIQSFIIMAGVIINYFNFINPIITRLIIMYSLSIYSLQGYLHSIYAFDYYYCYSYQCYPYRQANATSFQKKLNTPFMK